MLARRSSAIIAISDRQKRDLAYQYKLCAPEKIHVIPLGFDLSRFRENSEHKRKVFRERFLLDDDEIAIGIIGRLVPVKNHSLFLVSAAEIMKKTRKKVRFFIIGDGESREMLIKEAAGLGLTQTYFPSAKMKATITFCSWIRNVDVAVSGLDIVTLTSFNEGTPVSLIEAQAGNRPIVTTDVGGIENVVRPDVTALLVSSNNYVEFTEALLKLIEDDALRAEMGKNGWEFVKEKFHFTRLISEMSTIYNALLRKKYRTGKK
jgi:glycosyltransferase involved in cell wall biosynthesis